MERRKRWGSLAAAFAWLSVCGPAFASDAPIPIVVTDRGQVRGLEAEGVRVFRGIRYARPPVGDLRWRAAQPADAWQDVKEATSFGPACSQPARSPNNRRPDGLGASPETTSEG